MGYAKYMEDNDDFIVERFTERKTEKDRRIALMATPILSFSEEYGQGSGEPESVTAGWKLPQLSDK